MNDSSLSGQPPAAGTESLHTLPEIATTTGIPLDDLKHYRREYALRIPIAGSAGARRYPEAAVETFRAIHREQTDKVNGGNGGNGGATVHGRRLLSLAAQRQTEAATGGPGAGDAPGVSVGSGEGGSPDAPHRLVAVDEEAPATEAPVTELPVTEPPVTELSSPAETETADAAEVLDPGPPSAFEELSSALALLAPAAPETRPAEARRQADRSVGDRPLGDRPLGDRPARGRDEAALRVAERRGATRHRAKEVAAPAARSVRWPEARPVVAAEANAEPTPAQPSGMPPRPPRRPTPPPQRPRGAETGTGPGTDLGGDAAARFLGLDSPPDAAPSAPASPTPAAAAPRQTPAAGEDSLQTTPATLASGGTASLTSADPASADPTSAAPTPAPPTPAPPLPSREPRPTRPIYTLQQIHELTAIPYAKLSLFAARHFDDVPWVGERYSPAYTRQGLEAFCRLYASENPDWEMPPLGPERGWDDLGGLAARITALESVQAALGDALERAVEEFLRPWSGEAHWEV